MSELFPHKEPLVFTAMAPGVMGRGWSSDVPIQVSIWMCGRCGAVIGSKDQHERWHGSVDTAATTLLTHDGVRADKAVDPHDDRGGQRDTIRGSNR